MIKVESFELDHTKVKAPYVRKAGEDERNGVKITKFDLRFLQPNEKEMPTGAIHTIEHFLATFMREKMDGIIDISPMGCRTGFYMIAWGDVYVDTDLTMNKKYYYKVREILYVRCGNDRSIWKLLRLHEKKFSGCSRRRIRG